MQLQVSSTFVVFFSNLLRFLFCPTCRSCVWQIKGFRRAKLFFNGMKVSHGMFQLLFSGWLTVNPNAINIPSRSGIYCTCSNHYTNLISNRCWTDCIEAGTHAVKEGNSLLGTVSSKMLQLRCTEAPHSF